MYECEYKVGLAGPEQVRKVRTWLDDHFNRLRIVETNYCEVPLFASCISAAAADA